MFAKTKISFFLLFWCCSFCLAPAARGGDKEYTGQFDAVLTADKEDTETVVFKYVAPEKIKDAQMFGEDAHVSSTRLYSPQTDSYSVLSMLVEEAGETPKLFVDLNGDKAFTDNEKFSFKREYEGDNDYWIMDLNLPVKNSSFAAYPIYLNFLKRYKTDNMTDNDRLVKQSTKAFARGSVDFKGKKVMVQYSYDYNSGQVNPTNGSLGADVDGDGEIDMDSTSPEALTVKDETAIFHIGDSYFSTKKADVKKIRSSLSNATRKISNASNSLPAKNCPILLLSISAAKNASFRNFAGNMC